MPKRCSDSIASFEALLDTVPTQIWMVSDERTYDYANAAHAAFLRLSRRELEHRDLAQVLPAEVAEDCIRHNRAAFQTRRPVVSEEWAPDEAGRMRLLRVIRTPRLDDAGNVLFLSCSAEDITERKQMERELKRYNENLEDLVQEKVQELADALWGTISSLVQLAETRDDDTGGHLKRISDTCRTVATVLSLNSIYSEKLNYDFIYNIQRASMLHDIGKVGIPDSILLKPGKLTREEFDQMKRHTTIGTETLRQAYPHYKNNGILNMAIDIASGHHERWDGKGYPSGLKGNDIPLSAQIVAICDVYDALRSKRVYKPAYSHEESLAEIRRECGSHFNPAICDAFFKCADEVRHIYEANLS